MKKHIVVLLVAGLLAACQNPAGKKSTEAAAEPKEEATAAWTLEEIWSTDTLMKTCESVRYDAEGSQLIIACINGAPWEKDGQGYLALLNLDGSIKAESWVSGLNAPKGMGILDGKLFVADVDQIVVVDMAEGKVLKKIDIPDATNLNDVAVGPGGTVYFTDSGTGLIWKLKDCEPETLMDATFERPNGLFIEEDRILLASSGSSDLRVIDKASLEYEVTVEGIGHGDGVEFTGQKGHYLVSDWSGEVHLILPDGSKQSLLNTKEQEINSADIGFNMEEQIVYVPTFFNNRVIAYRLIAPAE